MKELMEKAKEFTEKDDEIYSEKSVRRNLKEKYNNHIFFTDIPVRESVINFKEMVSYVLLEKKKRTEESKESIIIAAAKIIKEELRELRKDNPVYPTFEELRSSESEKEWVPESLQLLLQHLIPSNVKQLNIGQCIAQASRPRSIICPVLFGLCIQVQKSFASKWLVNHLYRLGYPISYDEILRFKHSVMDSSKSPIPSYGSFCQ